MRISSCLVATAIAAAACKPAATPPPPDTTAAARAAIDAANANWPRLTSSGHADSIADFYAADAVMMPPNMPTIQGRDSIRAFFATMNSGLMKGTTITLRAVSVAANGPSATEQGRWNFTWPAGTKPPPGAPAADSGKYLVHWVQDTGKWLIAQDIWNSDLPLPGTPPAQPAPKKSR